MGNGAGTLERVGMVLGRILAPLENRADPASIVDLLGELGLQLPEELTDDIAFISVVGAMAGEAAALPGRIDALQTAIESDDVASILAESVELLAAIVAVANAIDGVGHPEKNCRAV